MILGFSKTFPWGSPTGFPEQIIDGQKIHTIREDKNRRWREGMKIHFATGTRTPDYDCFMEGVCTGVQDISIIYKPNGNHNIVIDGTKYTSEDQLDAIAINDGFYDFSEFCRWFSGDFDGKLIHWTDLKY